MSWNFAMCLSKTQDAPLSYLWLFEFHGAFVHFHIVEFCKVLLQDELGIVEAGRLAAKVLVAVLAVHQMRILAHAHMNVVLFFQVRRNVSLGTQVLVAALAKRHGPRCVCVFLNVASCSSLFFLVCVVFVRDEECTALPRGRVA